MVVTREFSRSTSEITMPKSRLSSGPSALPSRTISTDPEIELSGFRISCASPVASCPKAARRWAASARFRRVLISVRS